MTDGNRATEKITFPRALYILVLFVISSLFGLFLFFATYRNMMASFLVVIVILLLLLEWERLSRKNLVYAHQKVNAQKMPLPKRLVTVSTPFLFFIISQLGPEQNLFAVTTAVLGMIAVFSISLVNS
ncbi:hypothetical protein [Corynebacterium propinquum]